MARKDENDSRPIVLIGLLGVGALLLSKRTKANKPPEQVAAEHGASCPPVGAGLGAIADAPYFNPGAIISSSIDWNGKVTYPHQCFHESFESPYYGWRALFLNLYAYLNQGIDTIGEIIPTWAGNAAPNYRAFVLSYLQNRFPGISENQILTAGSPELFELAQAIARYENAPEYHSIVEGQMDDAQTAFNDVF